MTERRELDGDCRDRASYAHDLLSRQRREMSNTRQASFRLGPEAERQLGELAGLSGNTRTEVLRELISIRYAGLHSAEERSKKSKSGEADPAQMLLDEILAPEVDGDR